MSPDRIRSSDLGTVEVFVDGAWEPYVPGMLLTRSTQLRAWVVASGEEWRRVAERRWRLSTSYVVAFATFVAGFCLGSLARLVAP